MLAAEQLAFQQSGGKVGNFKLRFVTLSAAKASDNARTAIQDDNAIAYLGEISPACRRTRSGSPTPRTSCR